MAPVRFLFQPRIGHFEVAALVILAMTLPWYLAIPSYMALALFADAMRKTKLYGEGE